MGGGPGAGEGCRWGQGGGGPGEHVRHPRHVFGFRYVLKVSQLCSPLLPVSFVAGYQKVPPVAGPLGLYVCNPLN